MSRPQVIWFAMITAMNTTLLAFVLTCAGSAQDPPEPFQDLSFEAALEKASKSDRMVFIDFFTTWCGPCKRLDRETWKDGRVRDWLVAETVALKIDAEKYEDLADRFKVRSYPTLLFVDSKGNEIDRLVGFRDADRFLVEAKDARAGRTVIERLRDELSTDPNNPRGRMELGDALRQRGEFEEALEHYLWVWDHVLDHDRSYIGVRGSFLLSDIERLGNQYPPAIQALKDRRATCEQRLMDGTAVVQDALDLATLDDRLEGAKATLRTFNLLESSLAYEGKLTVQVQLLSALSKRIRGPLLEARRYSKLLEVSGDPRARFADLAKQAESRAEKFEGEPDIARLASDRALKFGMECYEAFVGTMRLSEANALARDIVAFSTEWSTVSQMIRHVRRAGVVEALDDLRELAHKDIAKRHHRILDVNIKRARKKIEKAKQSKDK